MIIPWRVDVPQEHQPFVNWLIVGGIIAAFVLQTMSVRDQRRKLPAKFKAVENMSIEELAADLEVDEKDRAGGRRTAEDARRDFRTD